MKLLINKLAIARGEEFILQDVSFTVVTGQGLLVQGANGSGKSTLLRALAGLLPSQSGSISIVDPEPQFSGHSVASQCHYLGIENAMKSALSVAENLIFWRQFSGEPHLSIDEALAMMGLDGLQDLPFGHLSTGQRRRVAIARLLLNWRPIWLLDEPTSGLDKVSEAQFADVMGVHLEDGGMIIAATHLPLDLDNTRILTLANGSIEGLDTKETNP